MPYRTSQGRTVDYPHGIAAKLLHKGCEDITSLVDATHKLFREMQNLDSELITLREENKRLKHENEFMLRLINARENGSS